MITDTITNATRYAALHPDFADAVQLLQMLDFAALPDGQVPCANPNIRLFVGSEPMRSKTEAKPEAHLKHIDIQVPISGEETYGWIDRGRLKNGLGYDEKRDIEFFDCEPETWLTLQPGEFALFFPNAHTPRWWAEKSPYAKPYLKSVLQNKEPEMSFWKKLFGGKPKLMDWRDFCQHFADAANREPGVSAVIEWADTLRDTYIAITAQGEAESGRLYVANAYAQYSQDPEGLDGLLAAHLTVMRQMASTIQESVAIESGQIRITLKNASWLDEMRELNGPSTEELPLCEPLAGDILLVYMLDLSTAMRSMTQADADKLGLSDRTKLRETALDNIRRLIRQDGLETDRAEGHSLCQIRLDGFYDTALVLLLDEILHDNDVLAANPVFSVPARDALLLCNPADEESLYALADLTRQAYDESAYTVSDILYQYHKGSISIFQSH